MTPAEVAKVEQLNNPVESAKAVGLRYVSDNAKGIRREKAGRDFRYRAPDGRLISDKQILGRIKALAIPPAWTQVWVCPDPDGHLQATGRDARGRKQHRYHRRWREIRDETKYARMVSFARALPAIRRRVAKDLRLAGLTRERVLAAVVRLLEVTLIRVGNDEYARENDSFGLTTMRNRHVKINGEQLKFHFRGKAGKWRQVDIRNRRLARIVKRCQELPGQELFQYVNEQGQVQDVRSGDVNDYLREISGQDFTAKDFRTWAGTVLGAMALREFQRFDSKAEAKKNIVAAIESVAQRLGNTPAVCRRCYVHPDIINAYLDGTLVNTLKQRAEARLRQGANDLRPTEAAVLGLLQQRLALAQGPGRTLHALLRKSLTKARGRRSKLPAPSNRRGRGSAQSTR